jgi:tRNA 2-thiouridine synthesizing protein E
MTDQEHKTYELDEYGFLKQPEMWNHDVAVDIAQIAGITTLTDEHWKAIDYYHTYYDKYGLPPMWRNVIRHTGISMERMTQLFPPKPEIILKRVSGLMAVDAEDPDKWVRCDTNIRREF